MYTLRTIIDGNYQINTNLSNQYSLVLREENYEEFKKAFYATFKENHVADLDDTSNSMTTNCYGFVFAEGGEKAIPLYKKQFNYIMTDSGKTFSNLTYKQ